MLEYRGDSPGAGELVFVARGGPWSPLVIRASSWGARGHVLAIATPLAGPSR